MYIGKLILCGMLLGGCASSSLPIVGDRGTAFPLTASSTVPSARGEVRSSYADNGNTRIRVNVKHLAPPEKLAQGATVFVVWGRPTTGGDGRLQNLGALRVDKDLEGSLDVVTPYKEMEVSITPEEVPTVERPSGAPVLSGQIMAR